MGASLDLFLSANGFSTLTPLISPKLFHNTSLGCEELYGPILGATFKVQTKKKQEKYKKMWIRARIIEREYMDSVTTSIKTWLRGG